jgi:hypothetical protein
MKLPLRGAGVDPRPARNRAIALFLLSGLAVACGHEYAEVGATSTTSAAQPSKPVSAEAVDAIAGTRCRREMRCDNVGAARRYVSYDGCTTEIRGDAMNHLTTHACPNGIDSAQLDKCLADIRGERCSNVLDTIDRVTTCSTSSLCPR